jgi:hypothetical protein
MKYALVFNVVHFKYNEKFDYKKYLEKKKEPKKRLYATRKRYN